MKIEDALVILLKATVEMDDQPEIRRARERANKRELGIASAVYIPSWTEQAQN